MRLVVQRVTSASVDVEGECIASISSGFLVLAGAEEGDGDADAEYAAQKLAGLRVFEDDEGKMNRDIAEARGEILLVSQFTLLGDARKGRRPSFSSAARPETAIPLLDKLKARLVSAGIAVKTGRFGADMKVSLVNDGPVTIVLDSRRTF